MCIFENRRFVYSSGASVTKKAVDVTAHTVHIGHSCFFFSLKNSMMHMVLDLTDIDGSLEAIAEWWNRTPL